MLPDNEHGYPRVGQSVVCVNEEWIFSPELSWAYRPTLRSVYEISAVLTPSELARRGFENYDCTFVRLAEADRRHGGREFWYACTHFRPCRTTRIDELLRVTAPTPTELEST